MIKIISPTWTYIGMGYCDQISEKNYFEEEYITEERANKLLEKAQEEYNKIRYNLNKEPEIVIYFKKY